MRGRFGAFEGFGPFGDPKAWQEWFQSGPWMGGGRWAGRRVDRGDVKFLILSVLDDGPKHGYEVIREIEQRTQGAYVPSAGTVYPTLQMLEDVGHVRSELKDERRVYELTEAGRAYLKENGESTSQAWEQFQGRPWRGPFAGGFAAEQHELHEEIRGLMRAIFAEGRIYRADAKTAAQVREALRAARQQVDAAFDR